MSKVSDLTVDEFIALLEKHYQKPVKRNRMTPEEINDLADRLNKKIDIPIVNET